MHVYQAEHLQGQIERITFYGEESGFCVLQVKCKGVKDLVSVTGVSTPLHVGENIEAEGQWTHDKNYGRQFKALNIRMIQPSTLEGITKYLGSGLIKGIGPVFAKILVKGFGCDIFEVIENNPSQLLSLQGIGSKRLETILASWKEQKSVREIMVFLQSYGIGTARATRIYKTFHHQAIAKIRDNPYCLTEIKGIGFKTADELAMKMGLSKESMQRVRAGVIHVIQEMSTEGHCAVDSAQLSKKSAEILDVMPALIQEAIDQEILAEQLIPAEMKGKPCLYVNWLYYAEVGVASHLARLIQAEKSWGDIHVSEALKWVEKVTHLRLSDSQKAGLAEAVSHKVSCITGGPGVGKTTLVNSIIKVIRAKKMRVALCAPTGRAAKRLSQTTGLEAKTIHRLLEFDPKQGRFKYDQARRLEIDFLVIDESSMVDVVLMNSLLRSLPDSARVLIVGDQDQLPSVGPGKVLADLIQSGKVPTIRLTQIFRQAASSKIIVNAHRMNEGQLPIVTPKGEHSDFYVIHAESAEEIYQKLATLMTEKMARVFKAHPIHDVQVLTPMNRGGLGVKALNMALQTLLNPSPISSVTRFGWRFGVGDKVVQSVNNYDKDVFNGDLGIIRNVNVLASDVQVDFEGRSVLYDFSELDELDLAYATSIHKSQGSEYPIVIIPLSMQHYMMLQRNLIYTGVTRGKRLVILLGEPRAIAMAVKNVKQNNRGTLLSERIIHALSPQDSADLKPFL